jgi:glutaredoxin
MDRPSPPPTLFFYQRADCHLCHEARDALRTVLRERRDRRQAVPPVEEVDIDRDDYLLRRHMESVPVFAIYDRELKLQSSVRAIRRFLELALDPAT